MNAFSVSSVSLWLTLTCYPSLIVTVFVSV
jgi:hypothetical protein